MSFSRSSSAVVLTVILACAAPAFAQAVTQADITRLQDGVNAGSGGIQLIESPARSPVYWPVVESIDWAGKTPLAPS